MTNVPIPPHDFGHRSSSLLSSCVLGFCIDLVLYSLKSGLRYIFRAELIHFFFQYI